MRAISLNANGLRAALRKGLGAWLDAENPDLVFVQELQWNDLEAIESALEGWAVHASLADRPGYSGVAILSRSPWPEAEVPSLPEGLIGEGRYAAINVHGQIWLNAYLPSGSSKPARQELKLQALTHLELWLERQKGTVVLGGDLNLAPEAIDVHDPLRLDGKPGFSPEERAWFGRIASKCLHDAFRLGRRGEREVYSWWSPRSGSRDRNKGWRIDHWITNAPERVLDASYDGLARFSDHAPMRLRWS